MDKLNLNINNYSCNELEEIFDINQQNTSETKNIMEKHKNNILIDEKLSLEQKNQINTFLNQVINKLTDQINIFPIENTLVADAPLNHPLILNPRTIEGMSANINEGKPATFHDYPPGYINPINIKSIKKTLNIDTRFRPMYFSSKSTDFIVTVPDVFKKIISMRVSSLDIPLSLYTINKHFKNMNFGIDVGNTGAITNIVIPEGNYSSVDPAGSPSPYIVDTINTALNDALIVDVVCSIDSTTQKILFSHNTNGDFTLYFNLDHEGTIDESTPIPLKLGWLLGFRAGEYISSNGNILSESICSVIGPRYIYISIDDYTKAGNNSFVGAFESSTLSPNIIARINYQSLVQSNGIYRVGESDDFLDAFNSSRDYFGPVNIQKLHFQMLDEYGRLLDLNNMDWSCALTFDVIYD